MQIFVKSPTIYPDEALYDECFIRVDLQEKMSIHDFRRRHGWPDVVMAPRAGAGHHHHCVLTGVLAITAPVPVRLQERPPERRHAFPRWRASRVKEEPPNFFLFLIFF